MLYQNIFGGGADRRILCFFGGLFAMNVCIVFHIDCGFVFCVCFTRKIAKKWLGRHNVTIAIDSVTLEKSE